MSKQFVLAFSEQKRTMQHPLCIAQIERKSHLQDIQCKKTGENSIRILLNRCLSIETTYLHLFNVILLVNIHVEVGGLAQLLGLDLILARTPLETGAPLQSRAPALLLLQVGLLNGFRISLREAEFQHCVEELLG